MGVSVIIPTYKTPLDDLDRAIKSAVSARADDIVVVDDGTHDPYTTMSISPSLANKVMFLRQAHGGVCAARNHAIEKAAYPSIIPLDADDELLPDSLELLASAWKPGSLVYGGWYEGDEYRSPPSPDMLTRKNVAHATWFFNYGDWARVGGYDPDFNIGGEDYAFMIALVNAGVKPIRIDVPIYRKHIREGSRTDAARSRYPFIQQLLREKYPAFFA